MQRKFRIAILLITNLLTGCSAAIMAIGPSDASILHTGATRASINQALGAPIEVVPIPQGSVVWKPTDNEIRKISDGMPGRYIKPVKESGGQYSYLDFPATSQELYELKGGIVPQGYVGTYGGAAIYSFGLSEFVMIPKALQEHKRLGELTNKISVWYNDAGIAIGYSRDVLDADSFPDQLREAQRVSRIFNQPYQTVISISRQVMQEEGFNLITELSLGFLIGSQPQALGEQINKRLNLWVVPLSENQTKVIVRSTTNVDSNISHQALDESVLDKIASKLH